MLAAAMPATAPHIMRACHAAVSWCRALRRVRGGKQVGWRRRRQRQRWADRPTGKAARLVPP